MKVPRGLLKAFQQLIFCSSYSFIAVNHPKFSSLKQCIIYFAYKSTVWVELGGDSLALLYSAPVEMAWRLGTDSLNPESGSWYWLLADTLARTVTETPVCGLGLLTAWWLDPVFILPSVTFCPEAAAVLIFFFPWGSQRLNGTFLLQLLFPPSHKLWPHQARRSVGKERRKARG